MGQVVVIRPPSRASLAPTGSGLHTLFARQKNQWEQGCSHRLRASHTICLPEKPVGARLLPQAPGFTHYLPARKTSGSKACSHRLRASHTICPPEKPVGARLLPQASGFTHYLPARKTSGSKAAPTGSGLHTLFACQKNLWEQGLPAMGPELTPHITAGRRYPPEPPTPCGNAPGHRGS